MYSVSLWISECALCIVRYLWGFVCVLCTVYRYLWHLPVYCAPLSIAYLCTYLQCAVYCVLRTFITISPFISFTILTFLRLRLTVFRRVTWPISWVRWPIIPQLWWIILQIKNKLKYIKFIWANIWIKINEDTGRAVQIFLFKTKIEKLKINNSEVFKQKTKIPSAINVILYSSTPCTVYTLIRIMFTILNFKKLILLINVWYFYPLFNILFLNSTMFAPPLARLKTKVHVYTVWSIR